MATAPPSPERLELGPGVFWLRSKVFHCRVCPELAVTPPSEERARRCWRSRGGKEREEARGGEEERREGQKSRGGQALGGGRAKSQEHYIIAGAKSKREGYESVYWLHLSPSLDGGQSPCVWSPQYLSWSWDLWRLGQHSVCLYVCVCGHTAGFALYVRWSKSRGAHVEHWGPEESHRGLRGQWTVVSSAPLERNAAEHTGEREPPLQNAR